MGVRRAFLWASIGRYVVMVLNLGATLILARLLAPSEYGVTVLGGAVLTVAEALRAVGGGTYLIQKRELVPENIRACFTVSLAATILVTAALLLLAGPLARFFGVPHLERYLKVAALGYVTGPFVYPIMALMSRNMAFGALAMIDVLKALVYASIGVGLATQGFGDMSFAWASAASTAAGMLLYLIYWKDHSIMRPVFRGWRNVLDFGMFDAATALIGQLADALPYFIFGRLLNADAVGLSQRAVSLCFVPERVILAGVGAVALPAFSQEARTGNSLRPVYLRAIELITAAQWPSLLMLAILARPIVAILLGAQWAAVVPLVQILAIALLFSFPLALHYPTIVAAGAIRYMPFIIALQSIASIATLAAAARYGLHAAFLSSLAILPCNGFLSLLIARHFIGFRWFDVLKAVRKSMVCSLFAAAGPALVLVIYSGVDRSVPLLAITLALSAIGWLAGLRMTAHPLLDEMQRIAVKLRGSAAVRMGRLGVRLFGR